MRTLTILVDMDDTIEDLCGAWVNYLNEKYGTNTKPSDVKEWDITKAFPTLSRDEVFGVLSDELLWDRVKPLPGAADYLKKIIDDGHKVFIVTASHPDIISTKLSKVLFKYFPFLTYDDVIITTHKQLIRGDILIDDAPHNLEGGKYFKILYNAPHNQSYDDVKNFVIRVYNWDEVYYAVNCFAGNHTKLNGSTPNYIALHNRVHKLLYMR